MNVRSRLVQLVIDLLVQYLTVLAARFVAGKFMRWTRRIVIAQVILMGVFCGFGGLAVCIALGYGPVLTFCYAFIAVTCTICPVVGYFMIRRVAPEVEAELADWLQGHSRPSISAF